MEDGAGCRRAEPGALGEAVEPRRRTRPRRRELALDPQAMSGRRGTSAPTRFRVRFALQEPADLYVGSLDGYGHPILQLPDDTSLPKRPAGSVSTAKTKAAAYSYLSVLGGVPMRHVTWVECERRVKGQTGARFKKAASAADEAAILSDWGIDPSQILSCPRRMRDERLTVLGTARAARSHRRLEPPLRTQGRHARSRRRRSPHTSRADPLPGGHQRDHTCQGSSIPCPWTQCDGRLRAVVCAALRPGDRIVEQDDRTGSVLSVPTSLSGTHLCRAGQVCGRRCCV